MGQGVNGLRLGGRPEQAGDDGEPILLGLLGKGEVFTVGLALAGKCFLQVFFGIGH